MNYYIRWSNSTFILYSGIIVYCFLISIFNIKVVFHDKKINLSKYIITLTLIFIKGFGLTGRDINAGYYYNYLSATSLHSYRDKTVEIGYRILQILCRKLFGINGYWCFIFITALITILPVIWIIYKYQKSIFVPIAVLMYVSIYFFPGFSANRNYLALSISLIAIDKLIQKKYKQSVFIILFSSLFHLTSVILIIPILIISLKFLNKKLVFLIGLLIVIIVYVGRGNISAILSSSSRYSIYGIENNVSLGFEQFIYYIPLFIIYYMGRKQSKNKYIDKLSFIMLTFGFALGLLSYIIPIFGRMQVCTLSLILVIAYYTKNIFCQFNKFKFIYLLLFFIYSFGRFYLYISQYYNLEDLMPYINIFGLKI